MRSAFASESTETGLMDSTTARTSWPATAQNGGDQGQSKPGKPGPGEHMKTRWSGLYEGDFHSRTSKLGWTDRTGRAVAPPSPGSVLSSPIAWEISPVFIQELHLPVDSTNHIDPGPPAKCLRDHDTPIRLELLENRRKQSARPKPDAFKV